VDENTSDDTYNDHGIYEVRHPRCVGTITQKFCVLHVQSNTTIFHLVQWEYNYMFWPYRWATALPQQYLACIIYLQHILRNSHLHMYITTNENSHNNKT